MSDNRKRVRLREILAASAGAIAPGVTDPMFARLAQDSGYSVIHLSGNAIHKTFCLPDRDLVTVTEIATQAAPDLGGNRRSLDRGRGSMQIAAGLHCARENISGVRPLSR